VRVGWRAKAAAERREEKSKDVEWWFEVGQVWYRGGRKRKRGECRDG
jgi:hypothetical protein